MSRLLPLLLLLAACKGPPEPKGERGPRARTESLSNADYLLRLSMALRGVRPSLQEYALVDSDPAAIEGLVDTWLDDPRFGLTMRDMYAEAFLIRADIEPILTSYAALEGTPSEEVFGAMSESSLRLIEHVVMTDQPFSEVLTAPYLMANEVLHHLYGVPWDPNGPEWQQTTWADDRPVAGVLSDNALWMRYPSAGSNFHRGRATFVARTFLCDDFNARDIVPKGGVDLSDAEAVANAVTHNVNCVGCHQALEPLATFFWGYRKDVLRTSVTRAYEQYNCTGEAADFCYPLSMYKPSLEDDWRHYGLHPPAYYGTPGETFSDLGRMITEDPRFAECTARRFYAYFTQQSLLDTPVEVISPLQQQFMERLDAKALVKTIVLSEGFRVARQTKGEESQIPMQAIRPEQLARTVQDLTGFRMGAAPGCNFDGCFENVDLARSDRYGFRAMAGGVDGVQITRPTHTTTPTKTLFLRYFATEAAGYVVDHDLDEADPSARRLLGVVADEAAPDSAVRAQITALHARILGEFLPEDDPEIDRTVALFNQAVAQGQTQRSAWKLVISALLQDPRMLFY